MIETIIMGATASGKSDYAIDLAIRTGAEIISADSRQVYQGIPIGTAQPKPALQKNIKHHLQGFLPLGERFSAGDFVHSVVAILENNPDKRFVIVGGTGFYLKTLISGVPEKVNVPSSVEEYYESMFRDGGLSAIQRELIKVDSLAAKTIDMQNPIRILRAITISVATEKPWSQRKNVQLVSTEKAELVWLKPSIPLLYDRINYRTNEMIKEGWLEEIKMHLEQTETPGMQSLGYPELVKVVKNELTLDSAIESIKQQTRHYAKRQNTYFRNQFKQNDVKIKEF
jgi:tRNA dimethylallyltransferase